MKGIPVNFMMPLRLCLVNNINLLLRTVVLDRLGNYRRADTSELIISILHEGFEIE